jgi:hypothetical protein
MCYCCLLYFMICLLSAVCWILSAFPRPKTLPQHPKQGELLLNYTLPCLLRAISCPLPPVCCLLTTPLCRRQWKYFASSASAKARCVCVRVCVCVCVCACVCVCVCVCVLPSSEKLNNLNSTMSPRAKHSLLLKAVNVDRGAYLRDRQTDRQTDRHTDRQTCVATVSQQYNNSITTA